MELKVGQLRSVWLPGGINRIGKILAIDEQDQMVHVKWIDYRLPSEWVNRKDVK